MAHRRILSFKYAFEGIWVALKEEPNLKFHLLAALLAVILGAFFQITKEEWLVVLIVIGVVISVELTNTAIEAVIDSFTQDTHPGAKLAKDISAGAVLIVAILAFIIGIIIYLPYIVNFL